MSQELVLVDRAEPGVAVLTLSRPPVNALNREIREALIRTLDQLEDQDDVHVVVLTGQGAIFCAGGDIKEKHLMAPTDGARASANRLTRDAFYAVLDFPKPVLAAVNGAAIGAGFVLAACCDLIVSASTAVFAMPEIDVGLGGGASFLQRVMPLPKIRRMVLTGERVPAAELLRLGAVEECVPPAELLPTALALARVIASKSTAISQVIRSSFPTVEALGLVDGFRVEQGYTARLSTTTDSAEARTAFLQRRPPQFPPVQG